MENSSILSLDRRPFPALVKEGCAGEACAVSGGSAPAHAAALMTGTSRHEACAAALRELAERLTTVTDYVAAGIRLSTTPGTDTAAEFHLTEILGKALAEANRADEAMVLLRNLLSEEQK